MVSSIQYLLVFNLGSRLIWPKAQHFPQMAKPTDAWPHDRWRRHGCCPQQFREGSRPDCSLPRRAGLGQGPDRVSLRAVRPARPSSPRELEIRVGFLLKKARSEAARTFTESG